MLCRDHMNGYDCSVNVDGDDDDASDDVFGDVLMMLVMMM